MRSGAASAEGGAQFILNFHGIGEPIRPFEPGEALYWLPHRSYLTMLDMIAAHPGKKEIGLTFDDGNLSDLRLGAPALSERRLKAQFFILAGKLGQKGYLAGWDVRELSSLGFSIGTHGMNHVRWDLAQAAALEEEVARAKQILEDLIGAPVMDAALPFGGYNRSVLLALRRHRFRRVYSSDGGPRLRSSAWPTPRLSVRRQHSPSDVSAGLEAERRFASRMEVEARAALKSMRL
ncbi:MAG TPA: polysaccharide deacetylase family protein [Roseiarcus sp.]|nr:polysaccharide deacetylase family protein [Roseiarcus sp.]